MSRGLPSMTALLALLAIAGFQNWDKIAEVLRGQGRNKTGPAGELGSGGLLDQFGLGGVSAGGILSGGLGELIERFKKSGQGETAEFMGQQGAQPALHGGPTREGDWPGGPGHTIEAAGSIARRIGHKTMPRAPRRS